MSYLISSLQKDTETNIWMDYNFCFYYIIEWSTGKISLVLVIILCGLLFDFHQFSICTWGFVGLSASYVFASLLLRYVQFY